MEYSNTPIFSLSSQELLKTLAARGKYLKQLREAKKISQNHLSKLSGVSRNTISLMENGSQFWMIDSEIRYLAAINRDNLKNIIVQEKDKIKIASV